MQIADVSSVAYANKSWKTALCPKKYLNIIIKSYSEKLPVYDENKYFIFTILIAILNVYMYVRWKVVKLIVISVLRFTYWALVGQNFYPNQRET